ncbi:MAG: GIY-YIG nuclease family protein [Deltaproteobacteria bacterium]|nr:MAG: GIY-YIG nuclease family protein [Deltaproteobacteria bacterium]
MTSPSPWFLYVLECADQSLYTGITTDVERRVEEHNSSPKGAKYTRARRPVRLVYVAEYPNRSEATKEERAFKRLRRREKLKRVGKGEEESEQQSNNA